MPPLDVAPIRGPPPPSGEISAVPVPDGVPPTAEPIPIDPGAPNPTDSNRRSSRDSQRNAAFVARVRPARDRTENRIADNPIIRSAMTSSSLTIGLPASFRASRAGYARPWTRNGKRENDPGDPLRIGVTHSTLQEVRDPRRPDATAADVLDKPGDWRMHDRRRAAGVRRSCASDETVRWARRAPGHRRAVVHRHRPPGPPSMGRSPRHSRPDRPRPAAAGPEAMS